MKNYQVVFSATIDAKQLQAEANKIAGKTKLNLNAKGITDFGNAAKSSGGMLGEFTSQLSNLGSTIPKVAAFGVATAAIGAFTAAVSSGIEAVFEMDAALTEFKKVSDISGEALEEYTNKATELGLTVARTGSEMISAATMFKKSGYDESDSLMLAEIAARYQNIADTQIDAADASSFIVSQMKAFNITAEDSGSIIDKVNEVANRMSVGTNDLSQAMEVAGSALVTYGNDINDMISLVTAGTEIMVGRSSQVARGLNTIAGRITKNEEILNSYGIAIYNTDGSLRSTYEILADLAPKWQTMADAERVALGETLAGVNQYKVLASVLGNFDSALKAHTISEESAGSAIKENQRYMESLEARLNNLKSAWEALANDAISSNFIKTILDAGTAILKFADSDIVKFSVKTAAFTAGLGLATKAVGKLGASLWSLALNNPAAIFLGLAAGVAAFALHLEKIKDPVYQAEQAIDDLKNRIQETNDTISQLESAGADESILEMYRKQAEDLNKELEKAEENLFHVKNANFQKASGVTENEDMGAGTGGYGINWQTTNRVQESVSSYEQAAEAVRKYEEQLKEGKDVEDDYLASLNAQSEARQELIDLYSEFTENQDNLTDSEKDQYDQLKDLLEKLDYLKNDTATTAKEFDNLADSESSVNDTTRMALNSLREQDSEMISNWNSMQDLVAAERQLRNGQKLEESQIQALIAKYPQLRNQIEAMRNGELAAANAIHAVGVQSLGTSKTVIANSKAEAEAVVKSAQAQVDAYNAEMAARLAAGGSGVTMSSGMQEAVNLLNQAKAQLAMYSEAAYYGSEVIGGASGSASDAQSKLENQIRETTDALKEQTDAIKNAADYMIDRLDEQIDKLKDSQDDINKYYDDWIERLQDTNEELEDQIELEESLRKLAEAQSKKVRVFQDGGFVYSSDTQAVSEAQREASATQRKKEQEDLIKSLEEARERDLASVDKQIEALEAEKDSWKEASKSYDDYLAKQTLGIDQEKNNWEKRLGQAKDYASSYLELMKAIEDVESGKITPSKGKTIVKNVKSDIKGLPTSTSSLKSQINTASPISGYSPVGDVVKTDTSGDTYINVDNVTLPNVSNPTEFMAELQDFARYASQSAGTR